MWNKYAENYNSLYMKFLSQIYISVNSLVHIKKENFQIVRVKHFSKSCDKLQVRFQKCDIRLRWNGSNYVFHCDQNPWFSSCLFPQFLLMQHFQVIPRVTQKWCFESWWRWVYCHWCAGELCNLFILTNKLIVIIVQTWLIFAYRNGLNQNKMWLVYFIHSCP